LSSIYPYFYMIARWIIALSSVGLALAWVSYFVKTAYRRSPLAVFTSPDGKTLDVFATENIIGRASNADISIPLKMCKSATLCSVLRAVIGYLPRLMAGLP